MTQFLYFDRSFECKVRKKLKSNKTFQNIEQNYKLKAKDTETRKTRKTERWKPSFTKRIGRKCRLI